MPNKTLTEIRSEQFVTALSKALNVDKEKIVPNLNIVQEGLMDSLAIISLIAAVNINFNISIHANELGHCSTINDIYKLIENKLCVSVF